MEVTTQHAALVVALGGGGGTFPDPWEDPKNKIPLRVPKNDPRVVEGSIWFLKMTQW